MQTCPSPGAGPDALDGCADLARLLALETRKLVMAEELAGVGQWSLDPSTGAVSWSAQVYRIHGVSPESFDPMLDDALAFYEPTSRTTVTHLIDQALRTGEPFAFKAHIRRRSDGAVRTVLSKGEMRVFEPDGSSMLFGVFQDVTEQDVLLKQVSADRERYRLLTQNATDVIAAYRPDGVFTYLSPSIAALVDRSPEDLVGSRTYEIIHPDDHARITAEFRALVESGRASARIEYRAVRSGGETVWVEAHPCPVYGSDGRLTGFQDVVRDISARRAAQEAAREAAEHTERALAAAAESERRYRLLAENATDMISRFSLGGRIRFVSPSCEWLLGYMPAELIGRLTLDITHPDDAERITRQYADYIAAGPGAPGIEVQFRAIRKDGRVVWLEGRPRVVFDAAGEPREMYDVVRDVTARKRLEAELEDARISAEAAAQAKSDFLANMSHELRTPLTAIIGFGALMEEDANLASHTRHYLRRVRTASDALLATVNDVLDFSKLEAGQVEICRWPSDPAELISEVIDMLAPQAQAKGLALHAQGLDALPALVELDRDRVRQVLVNLLGNAVKFTAEGRVAVIAHHGDGVLHVRVEDTGTGIPADRLSLLFQRFSQVDGTLTRKHGGAGLGLAICKGLVEAMGGEIGVESEEGRGAAFFFRIPAVLAQDKTCGSEPDAGRGTDLRALEAVGAEA